MADITPQGNNSVISELDIRIWMRDVDPTLNLLIDDLEFSPEEIRTAMTLAVDKWNDTPPFLTSHNYNISNFPFRSGLLSGTCANLFFIAANRYRRNSLKYNVPGGAVADQEKYVEYDQAGQRLWTDYVNWMRLTKRSINIEHGFASFGGIAPRAWR